MDPEICKQESRPGSGFPVGFLVYFSGPFDLFSP
jgi:hypothetical protein